MKKNNKFVPLVFFLLIILIFRSRLINTPRSSRSWSFNFNVALRSLTFLGRGIFFPSLIYWLILLGWFFAIWHFRLRSSASLVAAFILFIISALLATSGFRGIGETIMRLSFVGWFSGLGQALIEYKRQDVSARN